MRLKYEPASEPLHISVKQLFSRSSCAAGYSPLAATATPGSSESFSGYPSRQESSIPTTPEGVEPSAAAEEGAKPF